MCLPRILPVVITYGLLLAGCQTDTSDPGADQADSPRFRLVSSQESGVSFVNRLTEGPNTNILMYEYFYNGGGVAAADFNGDGLTDLYFTANMEANRLYLNRGNLQFEDVTEASHTTGRDGPWATGVAVADVNADGKPDLYLSYSGMLPAEKRRNELYINQGADEAGVPRFEEAARRYGLDAPAFTNQAYFLDYDRDGDLDVLLLNHNPKSLPVLNEEKTRQLLASSDPERGLRLYRNEEGSFVDATEQAGLNGSALSYGLGIAISDLNADGFPDFYLSNDYEVPDYLYINQGDGTFRDEISQHLAYSSHFSMGSDIADVNNDGRADVFTLDMLPADNRRRKLLMADDNRSRHDLNRATGFTEQRMRNMLHLDRGDGSYAEVGRQSGIASTDWSWSALLIDLDNDGYKDLHVTNGYLRDYTNMDFIKYMDDYVQTRGRLQRADVLRLLQEMPASQVSNYAFANQGGVGFTDATEAWGLHRASNSNGAVAADLDNDGDLDLVVNNINHPAFIYENTGGSAAHYLQVAFAGEAANTAAIGARVVIEAAGQQQMQEFYPNRGYLSSGPFYLHFGLAKAPRVDRLTVVWPDGRSQTLLDVDVDRQLTLDIRDASREETVPDAKDPSLFTQSKLPLPISDRLSGYRDFDRQPLLPHQLSDNGPVLITADLDEDSRADLIAGGEATTVSLQDRNGEFGNWHTVAPSPAADVRITALGAADLNQDGHVDLYIGYGGYHQFSGGEEQLNDRVHYGDSRGGFSGTSEIELGPGVTATVAIGELQDVNLVFVGKGALPGRYPEGGGGALYRSDRSGMNRVPAPALDSLGLVADATWADLNRDGTPELIVVGEWMAVEVFEMYGPFDIRRATANYLPEPATGWWNVVEVADLNGDGIPDLVVGNEGLNNGLISSGTPGARFDAADFDANGSIDPILSYRSDGTWYPDLTRDELIAQLPGQRKRYPDYRSYADATTADLLSGLHPPAIRRKAEEFATCVYLSGTGKFEKLVLPAEAQVAPVHAVQVGDFNADGHPDLLLAGNETNARLRFGSSAANAGVILLNDGNGRFVAATNPGLQIRGAVRSVVHIGDRYLFGRIGQEAVAYRLNRVEH